ncbi:MAG: FecR domain-containing protein [Thermodesulfovibrionia bacterium]|nr:FecR domain-containing protein [Thermodesulfovibrionia bacterium]
MVLLGKIETIAITSSTLPSVAGHLLRRRRLRRASCFLNFLAHYYPGSAVKKLILICALLLALPTSAQDITQVVGRVTSARGRAEIVRPDGQRNQALRRSEVSEADALETDQNGVIHVRFSDGAILLLDCNSSLKIQRYQTDGAELHLLRGRMRTITGMTDPEKYRLNISTGDTHVLITASETEFEVVEESQGWIASGVYSGSIEVQNSLGSVALGVGESFSFSRFEKSQPPIGVAIMPNSIKEPTCEIF